MVCVDKFAYGEMRRLYPADLLHYKSYSTDGIEGISIPQPGGADHSDGAVRGAVSEPMYQNGGRPSGVLTVDSDISGTVTVKNAAGEEEQVPRKEVIRREWDKIHPARAGLPHRSS